MPRFTRHLDLKVQEAWEALNRLLYDYEETTGSACWLFLIPRDSNESIQVSSAGKDISTESIDNMGGIRDVISIALGKRE